MIIDISKEIEHFTSKVQDNNDFFSERFPLISGFRPMTTYLLFSTKFALTHTKSYTDDSQNSPSPPLPFEQTRLFRDHRDNISSCALSRLSRHLGKQITRHVELQLICRLTKLEYRPQKHCQPPRHVPISIFSFLTFTSTNPASRTWASTCSPFQ